MIEIIKGNVWRNWGSNTIKAKYDTFCEKYWTLLVYGTYGQYIRRWASDVEIYKKFFSRVKKPRIAYARKPNKKIIVCNKNISEPSPTYSKKLLNSFNDTYYLQFIK